MDSVGEFIAVADDPAVGSTAFETEVEHLHRAVSAYFDVRRFQITMNDPAFVRGFQRLRDLPRNRQRLIDRTRSARDPLREVFALDQLHDQCERVARPFEAVNLRDVRMIERGEDFGLALEPRQPLSVLGHVGRQHLEGDLALQRRVLGPVDLAHAAGAQEGEDFVGAEPGAGGQPRDYSGLSPAVRILLSGLRGGLCHAVKHGPVHAEGVQSLR